MGAALSTPPPPPGEPVPQHGVHVSPGLFDALTGQHGAVRGGGSRPGAADSSSSAGPSPGGGPRPGAADGSTGPSPSGRGGGPHAGRVPLSPVEQEALRLVHADSELARALRRAQVVGGALLKVEEGETERVAARARELTGGPLGATHPATPPCGPAADAVAACFEGVVRSSLADAGAASACGPLVAAYEACARAACAAHVVGREGGAPPAAATVAR